MLLNLRGKNIKLVRELHVTILSKGPILPVENKEIPVII